MQPHAAGTGIKVGHKESIKILGFAQGLIPPQMAQNFWQPPPMRVEFQLNPAPEDEVILVEDTAMAPWTLEMMHSNKAGIMVLAQKTNAMAKVKN